MINVSLSTPTNDINNEGPSFKPSSIDLLQLLSLCLPALISWIFFQFLARDLEFMIAASSIGMIICAILSWFLYKKFKSIIIICFLYILAGCIIYFISSQVAPYYTSQYLFIIYPLTTLFIPTTYIIKEILRDTNRISLFVMSLFISIIFSFVSYYTISFLAGFIMLLFYGWH